MSWDTPDIRKLIEQLRKLRAEATTSANIATYPVPLGQERRDAGVSKGYLPLNPSLNPRKKKVK